MIDQAKTWFVVHTAPAREARVCELLARDGVETWLPLERVTITRRGRIVDTAEKVFASYVFAGLSTDQMGGRGPWALRDCEHVLSLLGVDRPLPFPVEALQILADRVTGNDRDETDAGKRRAAAAQFQVGEMRRILNGPFATFFAEVEEVLGNGSIKAGVRLFGRMTPVEFDPKDLAAA